MRALLTRISGRGDATLANFVKKQNVIQPLLRAPARSSRTEGTLVQFGVHAGNDVAAWERADAKFTPLACVRWTSRDNNDSLYPCVESINNGKYAYDNVQMFVATWSHKFSSAWNMQTEAYYTYQRDVPSVFGPLPIEANTFGAVCPFPQVSCFVTAWTIVNFQNFKISKTGFVVMRNEYFDDSRGQRRGTQTKYTTHSIGLGTLVQRLGREYRPIAPGAEIRAFI